MHQFCLLFIFSLQTEENHRASGELELCNLCTWAVMSSGIESTSPPTSPCLVGRKAQVLSSEVRWGAGMRQSQGSWVSQSEASDNKAVVIGLFSKYIILTP